MFLISTTISVISIQLTTFKTVVKTSFGQRRKTLRNSLKSLLPAGATIPENPMFAMRPEQLSVAQFIELTNIMSNLRN